MTVFFIFYLCKKVGEFSFLRGNAFIQKPQDIECRPYIFDVYNCPKEDFTV